jgi:hypothetical protein
MRIRWKAVTVALSVSVSGMTNVASTGGAPLVMDNSGKVTRVAVVASASSRTPTTIAGIKLLEDIFQRMHSQSQIAMLNKARAPVSAPQQAQSTMTDPMLAIKPKESYKGAQKIAYAAGGARFAFAPNTWSANKGAVHQAGDSQFKDADEESARKKDESAQAAPRRTAHAAGKKQTPAAHYSSPREAQILDDRPVVRDFREPPAVATTLGIGNNGGGYPMGNMNNAPTLASANTGSTNLSDHPGFAALQRSLGRFAGAINTLQNGQNAVDGLSSAPHQNMQLPNVPQAQYAPPAEMRGSSLRQASAQANDKSFARNAVAASQNGVQEYGAASRARTITMAAQPPMVQSASSALSAPASRLNAEPSSAQDLKTTDAIVPPESPATYSHVHEYQPAAASVGKPMTIAMQVPNVVNGIPLVKLGENESTAHSALCAVGTVTIQEYKKNGWRVYSVTKAGTKEAAAQLYMKHGMVEAMRIFDASLMPSDLGVALGDKLTAVKSKFGEPAFLISEPNVARESATAGLNYVYPISQVSFEIARPSKKGSLQVVSMLLFNMK